MIPLALGHPRGFRGPHDDARRLISACCAEFFGLGLVCEGDWATINLRSRAPVARQAHNLEVGGSIPPFATHEFDPKYAGPWVFTRWAGSARVSERGLSRRARARRKSSPLG